MNYKYVFLILNFNTFNETLNCIASIVDSVVSSDYAIVVVDNGSPLDVYHLLQEGIASYKNVFLLRSDQNLGFSRGNNIGYEYARMKLKAEYILQINSDTLIYQNDILIKLDKIYAETGAAVIGPDIFAVKQNIHQNPQPTISYTRKQLLKNCINSLLHYFTNVIGIENFLIRINKRNIKIQSKVNDLASDYKKEQINVTLHGSALFFTPKYIKKYSGMYDKTFLYREENILYYLLMENGDSTYYTPKLMITHLEDASSDSLSNSEWKRRRFYYYHLFRSDCELLKLIFKRG